MEYDVCFTVLGCIYQRASISEDEPFHKNGFMAEFANREGGGVPQAPEEAQQNLKNLLNQDFFQFFLLILFRMV